MGGSPTTVLNENVTPGEEGGIQIFHYRKTLKTVAQRLKHKSLKLKISGSNLD